MNSFDDDAMRYEKRSMVNDYLDQMKGKGFKNRANRPKMMKVDGPFFLKSPHFESFGLLSSVKKRELKSRRPSSLVLTDRSF